MSRRYNTGTGNLETRSEAEMVDGVRGRLMQAVRLRLQADVPVGVYLSGGLDSSSVAGLIAHLVRHKGVRLGNDGSGDLSQLHCFTVQFGKETGADESEVAQRTADWLGARFHPVYMDEHALATRFEDAAWYSENPFADVNGICKLALSEKVRSLGLKVVITGEGSDEHFGGYSDFRPDSIQERDHSWPQSHFPDSERLAAWHKALDDTGATTFGDGEFDVPLSTRRMVNHTSTIRTVARVGHLPFASWTGQCAAAGDPETVLAESVDGRVRDKMANVWHPLNTSAYIWIKSFMPSVILRYCGDNMDMANSIESRPPFLDHCLTEYANQLPPSLKMKYDPETGQFDEKYILRQAMKPFITSEVFSQRKRKFSGPTHCASPLTYNRIPGPWRRNVLPALPDRAFTIPDTIPHGEIYLITKGDYLGEGATSFVDRLVSGDIVKYPKPNPYCPEKEERCRQQMEIEAEAYRRIGDNARVPRLVHWDASSCCLTLEYLANGSLGSYLQNHDQTTIQQRHAWMAQAAEALAAVHAAKVIHCDVAPRNFMLNDALELHIADFAGSSVCGSRPTIDVSPRYRRPGRGPVPTYADDLFALGSVLYYIQTGHEPYHDIPENEAQDRFTVEAFPETATLSCGSIIHSCWAGEWDNAQQIFQALTKEISC
ncbi:hypothetical protein NHJ13734_003471 [Beauveria thailandica]